MAGSIKGDVKRKYFTPAERVVLWLSFVKTSCTRNINDLGMNAWCPRSGRVARPFAFRKSPNYDRVPHPSPLPLGRGWADASEFPIHRLQWKALGPSSRLQARRMGHPIVIELYSGNGKAGPPAVSSHDEPHINYTTADGAKATVYIQAVTH